MSQATLMVKISLDALTPESVAIIGASDDKSRIGGRPLAYMRQHGFTGELFPVNPNRRLVQGVTAYASIDDLPHAPDLAIVAVPASSAIEAVDALSRRGTKLAVIFSSGFAEVDVAGAAQQERLLAAAGGMRIVGPNSLGMFSQHSGLFATFSAVFENGFPKLGRVGIASQSGAYGAHIMSIALHQHLGISSMVMTGNEGDVQVSDVIELMVRDPNTDVIAAYAEGISSSERLIAALQAARAARKPVIVLKVGRSRLGAAAAQSHTASMASNDSVLDAVFAEFGAVRANSSEELIDIARVAAKRIYPTNNSLGVFTLSGGAGVVIADAAEAEALPMPPLSQASQDKLKALIPYASTTNPVDCTAQFLNDLSLVGSFGEALVGNDQYSSILGFFSYSVAVPSLAAPLRAELRSFRAKYPDRLFVLSLLADPEIVEQFEDDGFATFGEPVRAVNAIAAMGRIGDAFSPQPLLAPPAFPRIDPPVGPLTEAEAKTLLSKAGISCVQEAACKDIEAAVSAADVIGYPVVMKILSPDILHKSEVGGVILDVKDPMGVRSSFETLLARAAQHSPKARIDGVLVARHLSGSVAECVMGIHRDPVFGPIAMFGLGGIFVEIMKDTVLHRCPFGIDVAEKLIRSIKGVQLLLGARGRPAADIPALAEMLSRLSVIGTQMGPGLAAIDLNPVMAMPAGQGAFAVDAVIEMDR
jgi:acetate---CoA ligase (ADP-forming)